jgi:SAM-dependent methyltransferase
MSGRMDSAGKSRLKDKTIPKLPKNITEIISSSKKVLDLGCGSGWLSSYVSDKDKYVGLSCSSVEMKHLRSIGLKGVLHSLEEPLPFKDNSFDCIFASHVIEHFTIREVEAIMKEIKRILKPSGVLILATPTDYNPFFWAEWSHVRPYNHGSLPGLLRDFNFEDIGWTYPELYFLPHKAQSLLRFPLFFLKPFLWKEIYATGHNKK